MTLDGQVCTRLRRILHPNLNGLPTAECLWCADVAPLCLSIAVVLSLLSVVAPAAPIHKRPAPRWHGYGFLPGYQQPLSNSLPLYAQKDATRRLASQNGAPGISTGCVILRL